MTKLRTNPTPGIGVPTLPADRPPGREFLPDWKDARTPLKILLVEDNPIDAELVLQELADSGFDIQHQRVDTEVGFLSHLEDGLDLIISDFSMPRFSGLRVLELLLERRLEVPLIIVSGSIGEETAVEAIKQGATDYLLKDRLARLGQSVRNALAQTRLLRERREAAEALRQSDEALRRLNAELEERVRERTSHVESSMKELETFSYSVSHDLRAPVRGIAGIARALHESYASSLDAEGQRLIGLIRAEAKRMDQLINDLLAFSRAARQQIDPSEIDMTELARSAFQNLVESLPEPHPRFVLNDLPPTHGDRSMMRQVFANLLNNAVKFSRGRKDPAVEVSGRAGATENLYYVKDNGAGFDERYADRLFEVFQRLHSQEEFEGTGVGLALVQRIIHRHGGKVWGEGKVGTGATFCFSLPVAASSRNAGGSNAPQTRAAGRDSRSK